MNVDIFGSDGKGTTKAADKNYVDLKFITLVKNLATKSDKSYVDEAIENVSNETLAFTDLKVDKVAARIDGDLNMTEHVIYNVKDPLNDKEAVNKGYLERKLTERRNVVLDDVGLIPTLTENILNSSGYVVSASSEFKIDRISHNAFKAFTPHISGQWRVTTSDVPFWIQITCPQSVKVYRITVRAAPETKLVKWKVQGNTDGFHFWEDLPFVTRPVDYNVHHFEIDPKLVKEYIQYRIFVEEAEGSNPGLTYWQLFTVKRVITL